MSLSFEVMRDLGDVPGPQLTCKYFSSEEVFSQIGRVNIDRSAKGLKLTSITLPGMRTHVRPGRVARIVDIDAEHRGKVNSIQYSVGWSAGTNPQPYATCSMGLRLLKVA